MDLFDLLSQDERIIVLSDPSERVIYTWNQSLTLQCWRDLSLDSHSQNGQWEEIDCRTLSEEPINFAAAKKAAERWFYDVREEA